MIGSKELEENGNVAIVIWAEDVPVRILVVIDGVLMSSNAGKEYPSLNAFELLDLIEKEVKRDGGKVYDVVVKKDDFVFYDEQ